MKRDWESIEADYRAGQLSNRALASKHDVPESTIRNRAKSHGWMRDLSNEVQSATQAKLSRTLRTESAHLPVCDRGIVEQVSDENTALVLGHRQALGRWRNIVERLAGTLEVIDITDDNHTEVARSLNSGIDALGKAIKLEREAFNLDSKKGERPRDPLSQLTDEELNTQIKELQNELGF